MAREGGCCCPARVGCTAEANGCAVGANTGLLQRFGRVCCVGASCGVFVHQGCPCNDLATPASLACCCGAGRLRRRSCDPGVPFSERMLCFQGGWRAGGLSLRVGVAGVGFAGGCSAVFWPSPVGWFGGGGVTWQLVGLASVVCGCLASWVAVWGLRSPATRLPQSQVFDGVQGDCTFVF